MKILKKTLCFVLTLLICTSIMPIFGLAASAASTEENIYTVTQTELRGQSGCII